MTKENREYLMASNTPMEYIDRSLELGFKWGDKHIVTKEWLEKMGFTVKDLEYARNRHPYWKQIKQKHGIERNRKMLDECSVNNLNSFEKWNDYELLILVEDTVSGETAQFISKKLGRTMSSIQHKRQALKAAKKILGIDKFEKDKRHPRLLELLHMNDQDLLKRAREKKESV